MADTQNQQPNQPTFNLPQRSLTITGALTARLYQAAIRASRIDLRAVQVAMSRPAVRDPSNRAIDRLVRALGQFESELSLVEKDLNEASRETGNGRSGQNGQRRPARDARPKLAAGNATANSANAKPAAGQAEASESGATKRSRNRNRNNESKGGQPAAQQQQPAAQKPSPTPPPTQPIDNTVAADSAAQVQAKQQPVAAPADVAANIQAL